MPPENRLGRIFVARDALRSESRGFVDNAYTFRTVGQDAPLLGSQAAGSRLGKPRRPVRAGGFDDFRRRACLGASGRRKKYFPLPCDARHEIRASRRGADAEERRAADGGGRGGLRLGRLLRRAEAYRAAHGQRRERESEPQRRLCRRVGQPGGRLCPPPLRFLFLARRHILSVHLSRRHGRRGFVLGRRLHVRREGLRHRRR